MINKETNITAAVIAAGGKGTRLNSINDGAPKALTLVNGEPIIRLQIIQLLQFGVTEIHFLLGFKSDLIVKYIEEKCFDLLFTPSFHYELEPLGSGGSLLFHQEKLPSQFFYLYCDVYLEFNFTELAKFHLQKKAGITLVAHPNDHPHDSDLIQINSEFFVERIHSHPHQALNFPGNLVNAAVYVIEISAIRDLCYPVGLQDFAQDILPKLIKNKVDVAAYKTWEFIKDMGTPKRLKNVENRISKLDHTKEEHPVIFLDRDGTINEIEVGKYITELSQVSLIPRTAEAIKKIRESGFYIIVITNQPVIARGDITHDTLKDIHNNIEWQLGLHGAYVDQIYYCPHHPEKGFTGEVSELKIDCDCRKPGTKLLENANEYIKVDKVNSWFVGDSRADIECGNRFGINTCLITNSEEVYDFGQTFTTSSLIMFAEHLNFNQRL